MFSWQSNQNLLPRVVYNSFFRVQWLIVTLISFSLQFWWGRQLWAICTQHADFICAGTQQQYNKEQRVLQGNKSKVVAHSAVYRTLSGFHLHLCTQVMSTKLEFVLLSRRLMLWILQELTESAYTLYRDMVFVTLDIDEFAHWASRFVPKDYHAKHAFGRSSTFSVLLFKVLLLCGHFPYFLYLRTWALSLIPRLGSSYRIYRVSLRFGWSLFHSFGQRANWTHLSQI